MSTANAVAVWDFTLKAEGRSPLDVRTFMKDASKKWTFQLEQGTGENAYQHYQGRMSLKKKSRWPKPLWDAVSFSDVHLSPTSGENKENNFYVTSPDTRLDGPWQDTDPEPAPFTHQLALHAAKGLQRWEEQLVEIAKTWTMRDINVVISKGGEGKSLFSEYLEYNKIAYELPAYNDWKDIARCAYDVANQKCYLIDMPRAMSKKHLNGFYAGVETLKNGTVYEDRYSFKKRRMDRPQIIVFTNVEPNQDLLTRDRWKIYEIDGSWLRRLNPRHNEASPTSTLFDICDTTMGI